MTDAKFKDGVPTQSISVADFAVTNGNKPEKRVLHSGLATFWREFPCGSSMAVPGATGARERPMVDLPQSVA